MKRPRFRFPLLLLGCFGALSAYAQTVVQNTTYSGTTTVSDSSTIDASTAVTIPSGANTTFRAMTQIRLGPGFTAASGSYFHAVLGTSFVTHPQGQTVAPGSTATFTAVASGTPPFSYQWYKNGAVISGQTGATLTLSNAQSGDAGIYRVSVTDAYGAITSNGAVLTLGATGFIDLEVFRPR
jgi:hypothetical protein